VQTLFVRHLAFLVLALLALLFSSNTTKESCLNNNQKEDRNMEIIIRKFVGVAKRHSPRRKNFDNRLLVYRSRLRRHIGKCDNSRRFRPKQPRRVANH